MSFHQDMQNGELFLPPLLLTVLIAVLFASVFLREQ